MAGVRVLGPVEVVGPGGVAALPGSRQRALVGLLALRCGQVVPQASLIDALWGESPPRTAVKTLYSHVTRVRQALEACGLPGVLVTREPGYVLRLPAPSVDARHFADLVLAGDFPAALSLWRGEPFADCAVEGWAAGEIVRLGELRMTATEELWSARLAAGEHAAAVAALEPLVAAWPYRERLTGLLMLALYRCGRPAEALDRYQRLRAHLAEELGVDPGPELRRRYEAILRHDASLDTAPVVAPVAAPAQLPAPAGYFTGRAAELRALSTVDGIAAVSGPAGIGKTALALHWAHSVADRFPDGQLFLDMRGAADPMPAGEALPHLLRGLGVPPDRIPSTVDEQAGLYRTVLHGKRILIVLDNCRDAAQVLPLVPGSASCLLLVTSRSALTALVAHHAVRLLSLDVLGAGEAVTLLGEVCGAPRVAAEPAAAAELVELCGRLPLALRIAAATLAASRQPVAALAARLATGSRLDALAIEGDSRSVRTAFASAYGAVSPGAAEVFRLLGLFPGVTASGHLVAALTDVPVPAADRLAGELAAAHLVTGAGDRYGFHDLIRLYARECAQSVEPADRQAEVSGRVLDWYLAVAAAANGVLQPSRNRVVPSLKYPPAELPALATHDNVLALLDGERPNLVPVVRYAAESGYPTAAWQLAYLLAGFYEFRGYWAERIEICQHALAAARQDGDLLAESLMCSSLGGAYNTAHRFAEAVPQLRRSLALARTLDDQRGQGNAHNNLAWAYLELGRHDAAIAALGAALALYEAAGQRVPMALTLNNLGETHIRCGRTRLAFVHLHRALTLARSVADPRLVAAVTHSIGEAHLHTGDPAAAMGFLRSALAVRRELGDHRHAAESLTSLGIACLASSARAAEGHLQEAVTASRHSGNEHLEAVALRHLAVAQLRSGNRTAAADSLDRAVTLRARIPDAAEESALRETRAELVIR